MPVSSSKLSIVFSGSQLFRDGLQTCKVAELVARFRHHAINGANDPMSLHTTDDWIFGHAANASQQTVGNMTVRLRPSCLA